MEEKIAGIETQMNENARDFEKLAKLAAEKDALDAELAEKMERWEYLSELAQRIENGEVKND